MKNQTKTFVVPKAKKRDLTEEQLQEIKEAFDLFDSEGKNQVDPKELKIAMRALGFEINKEDLKRLINQFERTNNGMMCYDDFLDIMSEKISERDPIDELKKSFKLLLDDDSQTITYHTLEKLSKELGENMSKEDLEEMINEVCTDKEKGVTEEDFLKFMKRSNYS